MDDAIALRCIEAAQYMLEHHATVRQTAAVLGLSKSSVHKDDGVIIGTVKGNAKKH